MADAPIDLFESEERALRCEYKIDAHIGNEGELEPIADISGDVGSNGKINIKMKLQDLRAMRAELDEDIRSLERSLSLLSGASP